MDDTSKKILEIVTDMQEQMGGMQGQINDVQNDLRSFKQETNARFDHVDEQLQDIRGYSKEIDYTNERVSELETRMAHVESKVA